MLVRIMEQAVRDGLITHDPARIHGWQQQIKQLEDELDNPRALALPDWNALHTLAEALVARSSDNYRGRGDIVTFTAVTAAPTPSAPQSAPHRAHLDGRCWRPSPPPTQNRRPRLTDTTQRYLHPDSQSVSNAGALLSAHLHGSQSGPKLRAV